MCVVAEMVISPPIPLGFPMEIPIFDIEPNCKSNICIRRQLFAACVSSGRPPKLEHGCVTALDHVCSHLNLHRATIASIGDELPTSGWSLQAGIQTSKIQRCD